MRNKLIIQPLAVSPSLVFIDLSNKLKLFFIATLVFSVLSSIAQVSEGFDEGSISSIVGGTGMPTAYGSGNYVLSSGTWIFNLAERSTTNSHSPVASCALKNNTGSSIISPNIPAGGIATINFWGSVSSGSGASLQVGYSSNGGSSYIQISGSPFSLTTTPTLYSVAVNNTANNLLVRFYRTNSTVYLDDINISAANIATPTINLTGSLSAVNTIYGTCSPTPTSFSVSGIAMNAGILITPPSGFEVSLSSSVGYSASLTIGSAGIIASTIVYVRLKASATAGNYTGNIVLSSSGATTMNEATVSSIVAVYPLTLSGISGSNKIYDGTTFASLSGVGSLSTTVNADIITMSGIPIGAFSNSMVGNAKIITITGLSLSGTNSSSYSISTVTTTANIIPVSLTITGALVDNKTYDGTNVAILSGYLFGIIYADLGNVILIPTAIFSQTMVGNNIVVTSTSTLSGASIGNYLLTQPSGLTANITKASQSIAFTNFISPVTTLTPSILLNATSTSGNIVSFSSSNLLVATITNNTLSVVGIGSSIITASEAGDTNNYPASSINQTLVVNAAPVIIYQHGFENGNFGDTLYNQPPSILSAYLSNTKWTIKAGVLMSFAGSGGSGTSGLSVLSGASASPLTLTLNVQNGFLLTINSISFWRYSSGAISWNINVNGISIATGNSSISSSNTGTIPVSNTINGLSGIVKIQMVLTGSGSFRIDDFTINGNLISCGVLPDIVMQPSIQSICATTPLILSVTANNVTSYQWRKSGLNISGASNAAYSILQCTNADAGIYDVVLTGSTYCATSFSNAVQITIKPIPSGITTRASNVTICSGNTLKLYSNFSGIKEPFDSLPLSIFRVSGTGATAVQNNIYYQQGAASILFNTSLNAVTNPALTMNSDIDLTKYGNYPNLQFYQICALEGTINSYDYGYVEYSLDKGLSWTTFPANTYTGTGSLLGSSATICFSTKSYNDWNNTFTDPTSVPGNSTSLWKKEVINLSSFIGNSTFRIRFRITTDPSNLYYGWLIDNLTIGSIPSKFSWTSIPVGYSDSSQNPVNTIVPTTTTNFILTATNDEGCSVTGNTIISISPTPTAIISYMNTPFCTSADSQLVVITGITGSPFINASYTNINGLSINSYTGTIIPVLSTIGKYSIEYNFVGNNGCLGSATTAIEINKVGLWKTIATDSNWNNLQNWSCTLLPSCINDVFISNASNFYPVINDTMFVHDIQIENEARLTVLGHLNITGSLNNKGILDASIGSLAFIGSVAQHVSGGFNVKNFIINNTAGISLGNTISDTVFVAGLYSPVAGILSTNGRLVFVSNALGSATVGIGTGDYITGNITVQRYHSNKRAWLLISAPLSTAGTTLNGSIFNNWQQQTYITAPPSIANITNGMDAASNNTYGMLNWTGTAWGRIINTKNANSLIGNIGGVYADNKPFFLFIRGDRTIAPTLGNLNSTPVTLIASGVLQMGDKNVDISSTPVNGYALVANPYAAPINLDRFLNDNQFLQTCLTKIYYWDAASSGTGGYTTLTYNGTSWISSSNNNMTNIQSGQAFFVIRTLTTPIVFFKEHQKSLDKSSSAIFGNTPPSYIKVGLNKGDNYIDGVLTMYNNNYSAAVIAPSEDGYKFWGNEEGVAILRTGNYLSVEARPEINSADTTFLFMNRIVAGNTYTFKINANNIAKNIVGILVDKYLHTNSILDFSTDNIYSFYVDTSVDAKSATRFMLIFNLKMPLFTNNIHIKAIPSSNMVLINWSNNAENELNNYSVERSNNAVQFKNLYTTTTINSFNCNYHFLDSFILSGFNYYRIKAVYNTGLVQYSDIVKVFPKNNNEGILIYPNPIIGKSINLECINIPAGEYRLNINNLSGQEVFYQSVYISGENKSINISSPGILPTGVYVLKLKGNDATYHELIMVP